MLQRYHRPLHHPHPRHINTNVNSFRGTEKEENESFLPPKTTAQRASHGHHHTVTTHLHPPSSFSSWLYNARDGGRVSFDRLSVMVTRYVVEDADRSNELTTPTGLSLSPPPSHSPSHSSYSSSSCSSRQRKMAPHITTTATLVTAHITPAHHPPFHTLPHFLHLKNCVMGSSADLVCISL